MDVLWPDLLAMFGLGVMYFYLSMKRFKRVLDNGKLAFQWNLTRRFGEFTAVDNISCKVNRGEIFGTLGSQRSG